MEVVYKSCSGVDVHKKKLTVSVRRGRKETCQEFGTSTREIRRLIDWLQEEKCEMVAMESTGSYWKPLFNMLEDAGIPAMVVNAGHMKAVPGRKTDVNDAQWISDLLKHGLLKPSFIPDREHRELREALVYRDKLTKERAAEINRIQKIFEGANIKLSSAVSDITGMSARNLLREMLENGAPGEERVQEMKAQKLLHGNLKADVAELAEVMEGSLSDLQKSLILEMLAHIEYLSERLSSLQSDIEEVYDEKENAGIALLQTIPGIGKKSAETIIGIVGTDMSRFPTPDHLASWAGVIPGNNQSAGKVKPCRTTKGNQLLKTTLVNCANAAIKTKDSFLGAKYHRLSVRMKSNKAKMAIAHSIIKAVHFMLSNGVVYEDLGSEYYNTVDKERQIKAHLAKLKKLGWTGESADAVSA